MAHHRKITFYGSQDHQLNDEVPTSAFSNSFGTSVTSYDENQGAMTRNDVTNFNSQPSTFTNTDWPRVTPNGDPDIDARNNADSSGTVPTNLRVTFKNMHDASEDSSVSETSSDEHLRIVTEQSTSSGTEFNAVFTSQPLDKAKPSTLSAEQIFKITSKAKEIEQAYIQDCKTFSAVVKLIIKKNPALQNDLHHTLKETLGGIGEKFIDELYQFIESVN